MDEEDDYRYCQGEDDDDDVQQDRDDRGQCYHAQNDLTAHLRAAQQQDDEDAYRDMSSSEANTRYNCQQAEDEPYHRVTYDEWRKHKELHPDEEEEQLAGHDNGRDVEIREEVYDFDDFSFEELWK